MAEKAAHHTSTVISHPSIFEVIAQENLSSMSYPALKKIINVCYIRIGLAWKCISIYLFFLYIHSLLFLKTLNI